MQYVRYGNTGMQVSRFCLGAMTFPNELPEEDSRRIIDEALDHGVNFVDTADSYRGSEEVLGKVITPDKREKIYLATKVYRKYCRDQRVGRNSRVNIINSLERSLKLLNTDYVDLYQLHHPDAETPLEETIETLDNLVKQGKIRYLGVSNHYAWQMAAMLGEAKLRHAEPIVSLQANYNLLDRQIEQETVPFLQRYNLALICYGPLCGGILTGKYHTGDGIPEGSRLEGNERLQRYLGFEATGRVMEVLNELAQERGLRQHQLAMLWLLSKPYVTCPILGGSKPEHFTQIYDIADEQLSEEEIERLDEATADRIYSKFRNQAVREGAPI